MYQWTSKIGLAPGTLVYTGKEKDKKPVLSLIRYSAEEAFTTKKLKFSELEGLLMPEEVNWVNLSGLSDLNLLTNIGKSQEIHSLWLEDVLNVHHIPKIERDEQDMIICLQMLELKDPNERFEEEHISIIRKGNRLFSFQEKKGDVFNPIRERIENKLGKIRDRKIDYLVYALLDAIVDQYYAILEHHRKLLLNLEDELLDNPKEESLHNIGNLRKDIIRFQSYVKPLAEAITKMVAEYPKEFDKINKPFYKDLRDHINTINNETVIQRDTAKDLLDLYMNVTSLRMNRVMEKLTVVATIFIPLTFVAGIYGMNFSNMPELNWEHGYFAALILMAVLTILMLWYMKRKKWF